MTPEHTGRGALDACFLGPYGENDGLLEKLVVEFLRDHVYWRRNFHPEDPPAIPTDAAFDPGYRAFEARLRRELHALSAQLNARRAPVYKLVGGKPQMVMVRIGASDGTDTEISGNVREGDELVTGERSATAAATPSAP